MIDYPEKTCDISRLIMHPRLIAAALAGQKTQQRRNGVYGYPGETFELEGVAFTITALCRQSLGDMAEADAIAEGYSSLDAYKEVILKMHPGMRWDDAALVWVHSFQRSG